MTNQLTITDEAERRQTIKQERCKHSFIIVRHYDYQNDRIFYDSICLHCNYSSD
ncbi:MAG: hypothetical protein Q8O93_05305 [bacterium]|nr:hypothetical protein [bacterium]